MNHAIASMHHPPKTRLDTQQDSRRRLGRSSTVMQKPPEIQKCDRPTNIPTNWPTDWHCKVLSCVSATKNHHSLVQITLLGSGLKGPMSCRTQGEFRDVHPSVRPSIGPSVLPSPPLGYWSLKSAVSGLIFTLWTLILALSDLNLALESSSQLSRPHVCPQDLKSALQTSNPPSRPKIRSSGLKFVL